MLETNCQGQCQGSENLNTETGNFVFDSSTRHSLFFLVQWWEVNGAMISNKLCYLKKKHTEVEGKCKTTNTAKVVMKIVYDFSFRQWSMMVSIDERCNRIMLVIIILQEIHYMKNNVIFRIETVLIFENINIS